MTYWISAIYVNSTIQKSANFFKFSCASRFSQLSFCWFRHSEREYEKQKKSRSAVESEKSWWGIETQQKEEEEDRVKHAIKSSEPFQFLFFFCLFASLCFFCLFGMESIRIFLYFFLLWCAIISLFDMLNRYLNHWKFFLINFFFTIDWTHKKRL